MLDIRIDSFRGIKHAKISCSRIALLCGQNGQGKSSILDAVRCALDGTAQPYGLKKDELGQAVYRGADSASVTINEALEGHDDRGTRMLWPAGTVDTMGAPIRATPFATGSQRLTDLGSRERSQVLAQYLKTEPTREEFAEAMKEAGITSQAEVDAIWANTAKLGWDGAWAQYKTEATRLKGGWDQLTGATWGSKVGGTWRPKGWGNEHEIITDDELKTDLEAAQKALDEAIGTVAINDEEKKRLEALVRNIPKLEELLETRKKDGERAKENLTKAEEALRKVPILPADKWPECPHCKKAVQVLGGDRLAIPPKPLSDDERAKLTERANAAEGVVKQANEAYEQARNAYATCAADLQAARDSKATLEQSGPGPEKAVVDEMRDELKRVVSVIAGKQKVRDALAQHMKVVDKMVVAAMLAPEGLRHKKLSTKIDGFNKRLGDLCEYADWGHVTITMDGGVRYGETTYELCSGSERMRCDVTLQVAFAMLDGSEVILIDEADMLDGRGRNGLFGLLDWSERYCIVAMMLTRQEQAPDLTHLEMGATFWIEKAESAPFLKKAA